MRSHNNSLLLQLEFERLANPHAIVENAREWRFFTNAKHSAGVLVKITSIEDIDAAIPLVQESRAAADR